MKPALFLFLLVEQGILIPEIESFSVYPRCVTKRLSRECNDEEPGGKIVALLRKGGGSGGGSGSGGLGGSGKGAPWSRDSDISHRPHSKGSVAPSTSFSSPLLTDHEFGMRSAGLR